ncbi:hypothetical protein FA95DRAFT_1565361 [Auriscalpium vulgare]|uniref:Uncharacterized protein n=1 Tax=Auriscalpium vulgare TaxID=40419 RepID=A0ACB8RBC6_9AGAM|nr:hypothetical protein FA95DRAFT_1565361 [Auriscalpium vulgare]
MADELSKLRGQLHIAKGTALENLGSMTGVLTLVGVGRVERLAGERQRDAALEREAKRNNGAVGGEEQRQAGSGSTTE